MTHVSSPAEPIKFLIVDHQEERLLLLGDVLSRIDAVTFKTRSGSDALELLAGHEFALIILAAQMPDTDGFDLARSIRNMEQKSHAPIIFMTADNNDKFRRFEGYDLAPVDFLYHPIEPDILRAKAKLFFDLYNQQRIIARHQEEMEATLQGVYKRKNDFLATLAHELRNPLAPIKNGLKILELSQNGAETEKVLKMMDRQLAHLMRLIDDLLDVARVSQGKFNLQCQHITIQDILTSALEASQPLIDASHHTLAVNMPDEPLWLNADLTRIAQVINNLVNNAAKYTPDQGKITVNVYRDKQDIVITVEDNGIGIPSDMLTKVFDRFTQVYRSRDRSQGGLGIGLALVKQLVTMHNGTITAESEGLGRGSKFTVRLPSAMSESEKAAYLEQGKTEKSVPALNILVVDDNIPSAQTIGWMLEMVGHKPTLAHDGREALDIARDIKPDVILMDIGLPTLDGYTVCRELRNDPMFKDTMLVAQTGWGQDKDKKAAYDAGFNHHLLKPVDFQELSSLLSQVKKAA